MAGCTFAMGLKSDKAPVEAMDNGDRLFRAMMKGSILKSFKKLSRGRRLNIKRVIFFPLIV